MPDYSAPLQQMRFTIEHLADFKNVAALQSYSAVDAGTLDAVLIQHPTYDTDVEQTPGGARPAEEQVRRHRP